MGGRQHLTVGASQLSLAQPAGRLAHAGGPSTFARGRPEVAERDGGAVGQYDLAGQLPWPGEVVHVHVQPGGVADIDHDLAHGAGTGTEARDLGRGARLVTTHATARAVLARAGGLVHGQSADPDYGQHRQGPQRQRRPPRRHASQAGRRDGRAGVRKRSDTRASKPADGSTAGTTWTSSSAAAESLSTSAQQRGQPSRWARGSSPLPAGERAKGELGEVVVHGGALSGQAFAHWALLMSLRPRLAAASRSFPRPARMRVLAVPRGTDSISLTSAAV